MRSQQGVSMIEVLLVLVIASSIMMMGYNQYLSYRTDADFMQTRTNVETIFHAMSNYFRANCAQPDFNTDQGQVIIPVTEDKLEGYFVGVPSDLAKTPLSALSRSPFIDYSDPSVSYLMQFNLLKPAPDREVDTLTKKNNPIGKILIWTAQVSIKLNRPDLASIYAARLQALCLSDQDETVKETVTPCTTPPAETGAYAVWQQLPSASEVQLQSPYMYTLPLVKQFTQMYTTNPMSVLLSTTPTGKGQYFVCGS